MRKKVMLPHKIVVGQTSQAKGWGWVHQWVGAHFRFIYLSLTAFVLYTRYGTWSYLPPPGEYKLLDDSHHGLLITACPRPWVHGLSVMQVLWTFWIRSNWLVELDDLFVLTIQQRPWGQKLPTVSHTIIRVVHSQYKLTGWWYMHLMSEVPWPSN